MTVLVGDNRRHPWGQWIGRCTAACIERWQPLPAEQSLVVRLDLWEALVALCHSLPVSSLLPTGGTVSQGLSARITLLSGDSLSRASPGCRRPWTGHWYSPS